MSHEILHLLPGMIQFTSSMNDQNQPKYSEADLDRLQVRWVLGKNRGVSNHITKEEIAVLLDFSRISWNTLDLDEKRTFLDDRQYRLRVDEWMLGKKVKKINIEELSVGVVRRLLKSVEELIEKKSDANEWKMLTREQKEKVKEGVFRYFYGTSPDYLIIRLFNYMRVR